MDIWNRIVCLTRTQFSVSARVLKERLLHILVSPSRYIWEDVRLHPHHMHLVLSSLHGDLSPDLVGPLPPSAGYRYILSTSAATGLPATTRSPTEWSYGHHQPPPNARTGPRQPQDVLVSTSLVNRGEVL